MLAIVGPTASGKSELALELALHFGGEIVSCDSMQVYRGMDIGTAKVPLQKRRGITHHMLDVVSPLCTYSAADYARAAETVLRQIRERGRVPVFCGGTGLYLESALAGRHSADIARMPEYRQELYQVYEEKGAEFLHGMLKKVDPVSAKAIHPNNIKRVIRALEIFKSSGKSKSEWDKESRSLAAFDNIKVVGLRFEDRQRQNARIYSRVEQMIKDGLPDEVKALFESGELRENSTAGQAIGYKEIIPYLKGEITLEAAIQNIKQATRRYAKRQQTWFCAKEYVNWITLDAGGQNKTFEDIVNIAIELCT